MHNRYQQGPVSPEHIFARVARVMPFLQFDHDPYMVISDNGRYSGYTIIYHEQTIPILTADGERHQLHPELGKGDRLMLRRQ